MADAKLSATPMAKARYTQLTGTRSTALERARTNSALTIPGLVPQDGQDANASFSQPYQSLGARAVNNLSAWLLVTLFPPDQHFFRLSIDEDTAESLGSGLADAKTALNKIAAKAQMQLETSAARPVFMETIRHLVVAGNALVYYPNDGATPPRMWRLDQYVVLRDDQGRLIEAIVNEKVYPSTLDPTVVSAVGLEAPVSGGTEKTVDMYTHIKVVGDNTEHYQEINGKLVPGSDGSAPREKAGWMALRWQTVPGSDYGRAHVSEYLGDLLSLEDLSKAVVQFAYAAARIIHLVNPNSMTDIEALNSAETGDFVSGSEEDVGTLQLDKGQDFAVARQVMESIELRLSHAFMLQSGTVRDAERVTAEEIRAMAEELENVLGGVYTVLSAEFQLPLVNRLLYILQRGGQAPDLPKTVQPMIVTGFEAMGRNHSANKLRAWMADMSGIYGPQILQQITDPNEVGKRLGDSYGIEAMDQLLKAPEQQQQDQQQAATTQAAVAAAPQIAKGAIEHATATSAQPGE